MRFSCFYHSKYHKSIIPPSQCDFCDNVYFFLMVIDFQYLSFTSWYLRKIKSTLAIWLTVINWVIFFLLKTWIAIEELASTNQVSLKYSDIFFLSYFKVYSFPHFTVFCSYVCLLSKNLKYCRQKMQGAYEMCKVIKDIM